MPFRFHKADFTSGMAVRKLRAYADAPKQYLEEWEQAVMDDVASELRRR
jgi:hypothetical protein